VTGKGNKRAGMGQCNSLHHRSIGCHDSFFVGVPDGRETSGMARHPDKNHGWIRHLVSRAYLGIC